MPKYSIEWDYDAWQDYLYWQKNDKKFVERINLLIKDTCRNPYDRIGKPEQLKGNLSGMWSRRISNEHRFTYYVSDSVVIIMSCKEHYNF